jgi:TonB family protein
MKNLIIFSLIFTLLILSGLACRNNPLARFTKQYSCTIAGEPEPHSSEEYLIRARKHLEGNYSGFDQCAFGAASEAIRLDPKNAEALALRGHLYRLKKEYDSALSDLDEAIRLAPEKSLFFDVRASIYEEKGLLEKAIADLSSSIKLNETTYKYAHRGALYFKLDDLENALKDYAEAIRLEPENENNYPMRAEIYRKLGKTAEAEADELKAKELEEKDIAPDVSSTPKNSDSKSITGGILNGKATNLVQPTYPAAARAVRASGDVRVQVTLDAKGTVISASALSGHPLLRAAAVQAARESTFSPTLLSGQPVSVTGIVVYKFAP